MISSYLNFPSTGTHGKERLAKDQENREGRQEAPGSPSYVLSVSSARTVVPQGPLCPAIPSPDYSTDESLGFSTSNGNCASTQGWRWGWGLEYPRSPWDLGRDLKNNHDSDKTEIHPHSEDFCDKTNFLPTFVKHSHFPSDAVSQRAYKIGCVEMLFGSFLPLMVLPGS